MAIVSHGGGVGEDERRSWGWSWDWARRSWWMERRWGLGGSEMQILGWGDGDWGGFGGGMVRVREGRRRKERRGRSMIFLGVVSGVV